jgi:hypothetical protein
MKTKTMNTNKNKGHMDNEVRAMPVGLEIHKDGITITPPPGTTYDQMIRVLQRQAAEEEQIIAIRKATGPAKGYAQWGDTIGFARAILNAAMQGDK